MRLLVLGGTQFLGRHVVEAAIARGDEVTVFTRGRHAASGGATALVGDRDPRVGEGLRALERGRWDAAIDTSGYVPRVVEASARLLAQRVRRYLFVSSISAYAKLDAAGVDEGAALADLEDPQSEEVPKHYGALKAACEAVVDDVFGERATIVRPGLIVGPCDPTDRFGYWPARFVHPHLLGDRGQFAVVPAPPSRPVQFIDARDLAAFVLHLVTGDTHGTFNATSRPGTWSFGGLIAACVHAAAEPPEPLSVSEATLAAFHVTPWVGLPLWIPATEADSAGLQQVSVARAERAGLRTRSLAETVRDTAAWLAVRDNVGAWQQVLSDARERQLVSAVRAANS
jgi:2'-hydroxyisoflavone reductase